MLNRELLKQLELLLEGDEYPPNTTMTQYKYTVAVDALEVENELYAENAPCCFE